MIKKHLNEVEDFAPDRLKTSNITWLSDSEVKRLLVDFSHSEIRTWKYINGNFVPWSFREASYLKKIKGVSILFW